MEKQIIYNSITCLECNEVLVSSHRHDYKTCSCPNKAMIDGGNDYVRYGGKELSKVELFTVFDTDDFEIVRQYASRGSKGINGDEPLKFVKLCDMNNEWLQAVLFLYPKDSENYHIKLIKKEIKYRKEKGI